MATHEEVRELAQRLADVRQSGLDSQEGNIDLTFVLIVWFDLLLFDLIVFDWGWPQVVYRMARIGRASSFGCRYALPLALHSDNQLALLDWFLAGGSSGVMFIVMFV